MNVKFVDLKSQYNSIKSEIDKAISNVIDETAFIGGKYVDQFEIELAKYTGAKYAVSLVNGTSALHLALKLAGVKAGEEVLIQAFNFVAAANAITYCGATPHFVDIENENLGIDPIKLQNYLSEISKKTGELTENVITGRCIKALVVMHTFGHPSKMDELAEVAKKFNLVLIEDAAESIGSYYDKKHTGTMGLLGTMSFNGNKIITTSGGGALVTKNQADKEKAIFLATQARDNAPHYEHSEIGYNYRMSNIVAGIGRGQLEVLENRVMTRRNNFYFYKKHIKNLEFTFLEEPEGYYSNRWLTCILTPSFKIREKIRLSLEKENIESRPLWKPMHLQPIFKNQLNFS